MPKLTLDDLQKIRERTRKTTEMREGGEYRAKITVHMGTCGIAAGARKIMKVFMDEMEERQISDVLLTNSGCAGLCSKEPMVTVEIKGNPPVKYADLTEEKAKRIFEKHVLGGNMIEDLAIGIGSEKTDY